MTRKEMLTVFSRNRVPPSLFYFGPVPQAEMVNGIAWTGSDWIVYYREHGTLFNVARFATEEEANDEYCARILELKEQLFKKTGGNS